MKWFLRGVGAVIIALVGAFAASSDFQRNACEDVLSKLVDKPWGCAERYERIDLAEARFLLSDFYASSAAPDPESTREKNIRGTAGWTLLSERLQEEMPLEAFRANRASWRWSEIVGVREAEGFNVFRATVRLYRQTAPYTATGVPGRIDVFNETVKIERADPGFEVASLYDSAPIGKPRATFPRITVRVQSDVYKLPRYAADLTSVESEYTAGGILGALCQVERTVARAPATNADLGWWTRTLQGWLPNKNLETEGGPFEVLPACEAYHLDR